SDVCSSDLRDGGHLRDGSHGAVILAEHPVEHAGVGAAGPEGAELVANVLDRLLHLVLGLEKCVVDHVGTFRSSLVGSVRGARAITATCSPACRSAPPRPLSRCSPG